MGTNAHRGSTAAGLVGVLVGLSMVAAAQKPPVWFPWLEQVRPIQVEWTQIQEEAFDLWNNISQFQDFSAYERRIQSVRDRIEAMDEQRLQDKAQFGERYPEFFELSDQYVAAMRAVVDQLHRILAKLHDKSKDLDAYTLQAYQADLSEYDKRLRHYRNVGEEMNEAFAALQPSR